MDGTREGDEAATLYVDLMKNCLTRTLFDQPYQPMKPPRGRLRRAVADAAQGWLGRRDLTIVRRAKVVPPEAREQGLGWPGDAETLVGLRRLENVEQSVTDVLRAGVPGDLIETGVWRGGVTIFMRAILKAYGDTTRTVWVADSFQGLPKPDPERYPADAGNRLWTWTFLAVPLEQVQANFARYGLLDEQVRFLPGWFRDTLPNAPIERLAVLRLDGDLYESTIEALRALYPKLSVGGYVIVDDYHVFPECRAAVDDYRTELGIGDEVRRIDWAGAYWQRRS